MVTTQSGFTFIIAWMLAAPPAAPANDAEIDRLIRDLGHSRFSVRESASRRLLEIGRPARTALRVVEESDIPEVRRRAARILRALDRSVPVLVADLRGDDPAERRRAVGLLTRLGPGAVEAVPALLAALDGADAEVREEIVTALVTVAPGHQAVVKLALGKASVNGKYSKLLRRIHVPRDVKNYGEFHDFGRYQACDYADHPAIPEGYWVYVNPHWYIWAEAKVTDKDGT